MLRVLEAHPVARALRPFAHALAADRVWHHRLQGIDTREMDVWPTLDAAGCHALLRETTADWRAFLGDLDDLDATIRYQNSRGEPFESTIADVLDHVRPHAAHHRGQANAALRAEGVVPPSLDLIVWARTPPTPRL